MQKGKPLFVGKRAKGIAGLADDDLDFEALRTACEGIRNRTLADLDVWLDIFEERATASGAEVLWARDADAAERALIARYDGVVVCSPEDQALLGDGYYVAEDGLIGRTAAFPDSNRDGRSALETLPLSIESHGPVQVLVPGTIDIPHGPFADGAHDLEVADE